jgi:hypothetical protein
VRPTSKISTAWIDSVSTEFKRLILNMLHSFSRSSDAQKVLRMEDFSQP